MKNKLTQNEKNMIENQKKIMKALEESGEIERQEKLIEVFEKSGYADYLRSQHKAQLDLINKASEIPKITPIGNLTPTDKRIRKAEELLYEYTFNKNDTNVEDVLKALEIIGDSRVKDSTKKPIADGSGESYKYRMKCLMVYNKYLQLQAQGKSKLRAKNIIMGMPKFGKPAPTTLKKWLITGNKESKK